MKRVATIIMLFVLAGNSLFAQLSKEKYKKQADEVRSEVWGWNIKAFSNSIVPDSMKNYSYVVLARHQDMVASAKKKVNYYGLGLAVTREQVLVRTFRERVKLLDKSALEEYSSISYTAYEGKKIGNARKDVISFVGVKITKPNGTTKEVNADETVFTVDEKSNREAKLAIPDLEVGDILDYFVQIYDKDKAMTIPEPMCVNLILADKVPVLHYSLHGLISKKFALEHTSMNGAARLRITDDGDDWEFNAEQTNIPAHAVGLWFSSFRQLPVIRFNLVPDKAMARSPRQKPGHLNDAVKLEDLLTDIDAIMTKLGIYSGTPAGNINDILKGYTKLHGKIPEDSLAIYVYYAQRYFSYYTSFLEQKMYPVDASRNYWNIYENRFAIQLFRLFKIMKIDAELLVVTSKYGPSDKQAFTTDDFMYIVRTTKPTNTYFTLETIFHNPGELPYHYEGQNAYRIAWKENSNKVNKSPVSIPLETATQNKHLEYLRLSFDGDDLSRVSVKRTTTLSGHFRAEAQLKLLLYEDYYKEERERFGQWYFIDDLEKSKRTRPLAEEYKLAFQKARDGLKDVFTEEITSQFEAKPASVKSWKVTQPGLRHDAPELIYNTEFTMDHITKKAGNNYLLDLGAIIGGQLNIKEEQRKRNDDIYMPYARSFMHVIEIDIPAGYQVEGIENITVKVENTAGWFGCKGSVANNKLTLKIEKGYQKSFLKADEWPALLEMLDKAVALKEQKLLLKKI